MKLTNIEDFIYEHKDYNTDDLILAQDFITLRKSELKIREKNMEKFRNNVSKCDNYCFKTIIDYHKYHSTYMVYYTHVKKINDNFYETETIHLQLYRNNKTVANVDLYVSDKDTLEILYSKHDNCINKTPRKCKYEEFKSILEIYHDYRNKKNKTKRYT